MSGMKEEEGDRHGGCSHSLEKETLTTMVGHSCTERERREREETSSTKHKE